MSDKFRPWEFRPWEFVPEPESMRIGLDLDAQWKTVGVMFAEQAKQAGVLYWQAQDDIAKARLKRNGMLEVAEYIISLPEAQQGRLSAAMRRYLDYKEQASLTKFKEQRGEV